MTKFVPQLTAPSRSDKWFIQKAHGGYSECIAGKPLWFKGSVLDNCVGFAWGLAAKRENNQKCNIGVPKTRLNHGKYNPTSAQYWIDYANGRKVLQAPVLGGIIVYKHTNSNSGHLMSIEEIGKDYVIAVGSGYGDNGYLFKKEKLPLSLARKNCQLLGVIKLNAEFDNAPEPVITTLKVGDLVQITGYGNARADGKGKRSAGIGWNRYIKKIYANQPFNLQLASKSGVVTGYYKTSSVKKV